jgi:hypothetical protein
VLPVTSAVVVLDPARDRLSSGKVDGTRRAIPICTRGLIKNSTWGELLPNRTPLLVAFTCGRGSVSAVRIRARVWLTWPLLIRSSSCMRSCGASWYDVEGCYGDASFVIENMPTEVEQTFSEVGFWVGTGGRLLECANEANPCRQSYLKTLTAWGLRPEDGRASWDAIVTLAAVRGVAEVHGQKVGLGGTNVVDRNGTNVWFDGVDPTSSHQNYLVLEGDQWWKKMEKDIVHNTHSVASKTRAALRQEIDRLLCRSPVGKQQ